MAAIPQTCGRNATHPHAMKVQSGDSVDRGLTDLVLLRYCGLDTHSLDSPDRAVAGQTRVQSSEAPTLFSEEPLSSERPSRI